MAHVLLPCDLPNWAELQRQLSQIRLAQTIEQLMEDMLKIFDSCSVNLDPEDVPQPGDYSRFAGLRSYLSEFLKDAERVHFFKAILPSLVSNAQRLRIVRPINPFHYSLQQEGKMFHLDRRFLASLLANAIFSTFPRRTMKTHPTLQDFGFGEFFRYTQKLVQREKMKLIFKYFEKVSVTDPKGTVKFCRQVLRGKDIPSLPSWLCNIKPLCPIAVREYGNIEDSESQMIKACFCSKKIGGKALLDDDGQESFMFCRMPELLTTLCFAEALDENEALLVQGITLLGRIGESALTFMDGEKEADVVLMDSLDFSHNVHRQYEDKYLLRDLTKLLVAFSQPHASRRPSPVGASSGSSTCPDRGSPATGATGPSSSISSRRSSNQSAGMGHEREVVEKYHKIKSHSDSDSGVVVGKNKSSVAEDREKRPARHSLPIIKRDISSEKKPGHVENVASIPKSNPSTEANKNTTKMKSNEIQPSRVEERETNGITLVSSCKRNSSTSKSLANRKSSIHKQLSRSNSFGLKRKESGELIETRKLLVNGSFNQTGKHDLSKYKLSSIPQNSSSRKLSLTKVVPKRHVINQTSGEEEYYTADESADSCDEIWYLPGLGLRKSTDDDEGLHRAEEPSRLQRNSQQYRRLSSPSSSRSSSEKHQKDSSYKSHSRSKSSSPEKMYRKPSSKSRSYSRSRSSDSCGMALGKGTDDEDEDSLNLSEFEKYEDFRKRFRRRSRGLSRRRSSRHSRTSSSGSSEMEDIEEDPELALGYYGAGPFMRSANSEPSLVSADSSDSTMQLARMLAVPVDSVIIAKRGRKLVMTTGDGQLKAYSYDGVHPNLPVPFKAKFRQRRNSEGEAVCDLQTNGRHFYSQANAGFWKKVEAEAQIGVTSASSSQDESCESDASDDDRYRHRKSRSGSKSVKSDTLSEEYRLLEEEEKYYSLLRSSEEGLRPVATGRWGCGRHKGDPQLKAVLQWLAASVAGLPYLIYYTKGDPYLEKLEELSKVADLKQWTVGDVACETLRYSRNRLALVKSGNSSDQLAPFLFTMLIGTHQSRVLKQHESLD